MNITKQFFIKLHIWSNEFEPTAQSQFTVLDKETREETIG